jgi:uncharacterized oxidoreductase
MKTTQNTILITGGSAGIGLEMARLFLKEGHRVLITGRNEQRLREAAVQLPGVETFQGDVSDEGDVNRLVTLVKRDFPMLNIVINNAGAAYLYDLSNDTGGFEKAGVEMNTNFLSVIRLNEYLLPILKAQKESAIVNVSSIVALVPGRIPTYSASKAALHSYTQSLRFALKNTSVKVFELMPPLVNTEFSKEIGGENGIPPIAVAQDLVNALKDNHYEIHVGLTADIYKLFLSSPAAAFEAMNPA